MEIGRYAVELDVIMEKNNRMVVALFIKIFIKFYLHCFEKHYYLYIYEEMRFSDLNIL